MKKLSLDEIEKIIQAATKFNHFQWPLTKSQIDKAERLILRMAKELREFKQAEIINAVKS